MAHPRLGERQPFFIAPLWHPIEPVIRPVQGVETTSVARIGVEYFALGVFVERARAGMLLHHLLGNAVVMKNFALGNFLRLEGDEVVIVKTILAGRYPFEAPAHPF